MLPRQASNLEELSLKLLVFLPLLSQCWDNSVPTTSALWGAEDGTWGSCVLGKSSASSSPVPAVVLEFIQRHKVQNVCEA